MANALHHLFPGLGLGGGESRAFNSIGKIMWNQAFDLRGVILGAERHFFQDTNNRVPFETDSYDASIVAGQREVGRKLVYPPTNIEEVATEAVEADASVDREEPRQSISYKQCPR